MTYRDYTLNVRRVTSGWRVLVQPRKPDLPIVRPSELEAREAENALAHAKQSICQLLSF